MPLSRKEQQSFRKRTYSLPVGEENNFSAYTQLFGILENEKELLNISSFSISSPTLEDIFMAIIFEADSNPDNIIKRKSRPSKSQISPQEPAYDNLSTASQSTTSIRSSASLDAKLEPAYQAAVSLFFNQVSLVQDLFESPAQMLALMWKRLLNLRRDRKLLFSSLLTPLTLLTLAMVTAKIRPGTTTPPILLTPSMYGPGAAAFTSDAGGGQQVY